MKLSILISSYNRPNLLNWNLHSIAKQFKPCDIEIIVVNDGLPDNTAYICNSYAQYLDIQYIFSGERNTNDNTIWRGPCVSYNIAAKKATGDYIILSCAEIYTIGNTLSDMYNTILKYPKSRVTTYGWDDDGTILSHLEQTEGKDISLDLLSSMPKLTDEYPFFMAIPKKEYIEIGGYDEDFAEAYGYDDNDIMERLNAHGLPLVFSPGKVCHLYHERKQPPYTRQSDPRTNWDIYDSRKGTIVRNIGKEWGVIT